MTSDIIRAAIGQLRDPASGIAMVVEHSHELGDVTDVTGLVADLMEAAANGFYRTSMVTSEALAEAITHRSTT